jgi:rubrerythrin
MDVILWIAGVVVSCVILYFIIKSAVRNAIIEAHRVINGDDEDGGISKIICPACGKSHDLDYPKCPYCGHKPDETAE